MNFGTQCKQALVSCDPALCGFRQMCKVCIYHGPGPQMPQLVRVVNHQDPTLTRYERNCQWFDDGYGPGQDKAPDDPSLYYMTDGPNASLDEDFARPADWHYHFRAQIYDTRFPENILMQRAYGFHWRSDTGRRMRLVSKYGFEPAGS
jgi:hypothetical protein